MFGPRPAFWNDAAQQCMRLILAYFKLLCSWEKHFPNNIWHLLYCDTFQTSGFQTFYLCSTSSTLSAVGAIHITGDSLMGSGASTLFLQSIVMLSRSYHCPLWPRIHCPTNPCCQRWWIIIVILVYRTAYVLLIFSLKNCFLGRELENYCFWRTTSWYEFQRSWTWTTGSLFFYPLLFSATYELSCERNPLVINITDSIAAHKITSALFSFSSLLVGISAVALRAHSPSDPFSPGNCLLEHEGHNFQWHR